MKNKLTYLLRHKYYVAKECFKRGLYWQGITHDLDKIFLNRSCEEHHRRAKHHAEYWAVSQYVVDIAKVYGYTLPTYICYWPMPHKYIMEMLCDWEGARLANRSNKSTYDWYMEHKDDMQLHPESRKILEKEIIKFR